jgi:dTDP-L-rhamnose 4-epimerase
VGSHVVDDLVTAGHDVRVVDVLLGTAHMGKPDFLNPAAEYLWADLADGDVATAAVDGVDAVSHQAAMVGLGASFADVDAYTRHNGAATASLLHALHATEFRGRFVLASSMVVYGEGAYTCTRHGPRRPVPRDAADLADGRYEPRCGDCGNALEGREVSEDARVEPRSVYAATKLFQENLCMAFAGTNPAVALSVLRYHNVYGPRMPRDTPYAGVASIFRSALARGESPRVFEDGRQRRDFVHVRDVGRANVLALTAPVEFRGVCNIASGEPRTVMDMATHLADAAGPAAPRPVVVGGGRAGDVRHIVASPRRAAERLGFTANVRFADGMREFAAAALR